MDRLSEVFGDRVQFQYTCLDRIVLHGYLTGLQRPEQLVYFFHDVVGVACIEPKVLLGRTATYRAWVEQYREFLTPFVRMLVRAAVLRRGFPRAAAPVDPAGGRPAAP